MVPPRSDRNSLPCRRRCRRTGARLPQFDKVTGLSMTEKHIHDCTGPGMTCPCGFVFRVPPVFVSFEVTDRGSVLVEDQFYCETVGGAIEALREAMQKLSER